MNIYFYDETTKEYVGFGIAEADPLETKVQEKFVPLIPANATLSEVPKYDEICEIPVYESAMWTIKDDFRTNFYGVDNQLNVLEIKEIGKPKDLIVVLKELGEDIKINKDWYKIVDNCVVKKTEEEYNKEQQEKEKERIANLKCTKRVFVLLLEELGLDYFEQIEPLINANRQARLEWELASTLLRSNPLINNFAIKLGITEHQIDILFEVANNEKNIEELKATVKN